MQEPRPGFQSVDVAHRIVVISDSISSKPRLSSDLVCPTFGMPGLWRLSWTALFSAYWIIAAKSCKDERWINVHIEKSEGEADEATSKASYSKHEQGSLTTGLACHGPGPSEFRRPQGRRRSALTRFAGTAGRAGKG